LNGTIGSVKKNSLNLTLAFETIAPIAYSFLLHLTLTRDAFGLIQCTKALSLHAEQTGRPSSNQFPFHVEFLHSPQPNSLMAVMPLVILSSNFRIGLYSPQEMEHDGNCQSEGGCSELVSQCGESFECLTIANCLRTKIIDQDLLAIDTFIRTNSTSSLDITLAWKQCLLPDGESNGSSGIDSGSSDGDGGDGVEMFLSSLHCSINYRCGIASVSNLMASLQKQRIILKYIPKSHLIRFPYDFTGQIQFLLEIKDKSTTRTVQEISTDKIYLIAVALQEMYEELDVRSARTEVGITQNSLEGMFQLTINYFYNTPLPYVNLLLLDSSSLERTNDIGGGSPQASSIQTVNEDSLSIIKESII
jgi:hypothetical protein